MSFDMVFISNTIQTRRPFHDPSSRYRSFALAEYFRREGRRVTFLSQAAFQKEADSFANVPLIHIHRPSATDIMLRYVDRNRKRQKLIADYDDLIFDVSSVLQMPAFLERRQNIATLSRNLAANAEIGAMFEHRTTSTVPLSEMLDSVLGDGGKTITIHNGLDSFYIGIARVLFEKKRQPEYDLGYFSGTRSHSSDLALVAPQIAAFLENNRARKMLVVGPVSIPEDLKPYSHQITTKNVTGFYKMPIDIALCRMVIGPLTENNFNKCKSGLKFFEAGVLGTSVAATPIHDIDRFNSGLLSKCRTPDDWTDAFESALLPEKERKEAVENLLDEVQLERQIAVWKQHFFN